MKRCCQVTLLFFFYLKKKTPFTRQWFYSPLMEGEQDVCKMFCSSLSFHVCMTYRQCMDVVAKLSEGNNVWKQFDCCKEGNWCALSGGQRLSGHSYLFFSSVSVCVCIQIEYRRYKNEAACQNMCIKAKTYGFVYWCERRTKLKQYITGAFLLENTLFWAR